MKADEIAPYLMTEKIYAAASGSILAFVEDSVKKEGEVTLFFVYKKKNLCYYFIE